MTEVHVIRKHGFRLIANQVMKEGRDWRFSDNAVLYQTDIIIQMCANYQLKLGYRIAFTLQVCHVLNLSLNPFDQMVVNWQWPNGEIVVIP